ncbi:MAG TPA: hypothetical protein VFP80_04155 [Thermoanaerobaculia bacterium]|nr:hypothetical protein [Thermoanaerobaculia bacterium]
MNTNAIIAITLAAAALVDVNVQRVNDRRSAGPFSHLELVIELPKVKDTEVNASRVLLAAATDETGADLVDREREVELATNFVSSRDASKPATVSVTLKNPARRATKLGEVRGEIELYMPSKDPNSVAEIAKLTSFSGKPLAHKALKANGVEIALVSPSQLAAEKKKAGDAKRKEYVADGYEGESLDQMVSSFVDSFLSVDESDVVMRVKDPQKRIQEMVYIDGKGEVRRASVRDEEGYTLMSIWGEPPQPDWKLRVSMRTPKNLVKHSFVLKDVPLP